MNFVEVPRSGKPSSYAGTPPPADRGYPESVASKRAVALVALLALLLFGLLTVAADGADAAMTSIMRGKVVSGKQPIARAPVTVYQAAGEKGRPVALGRGRTDRRGRFRLEYLRPTRNAATAYAIVGRRAAVRLAATLGAAPLPRRVVINELTTVATGYALAQFIRGHAIAGPHPGPRNAALMAANLANARNGKVSPVLRRPPNGRRTPTLATFRSVANMLAACARRPRRCGPLFRLTTTPDGKRPRGTLQAVANIAKHPWQRVKPLYRLAGSKPAPYRGALKSTRQLAAWTMPVRFVGDGKSMDGPGNFAIDAEGNIYVSNNYEYGADPRVPRCGSELLPKFTPDGRYAPNSPFQGGGLSGAGYGITLDPKGNIWVGNFGFAAPEPGCAAEDQPPHNSISHFTPDGQALSGDSGYVAGDVFWPQGTVSDQQGTIWIANCGNGKVTRMPGDNPGAAVGLDVGLNQAFDIAVDHDGNVYATGLGNDRLAMLNPDGSPRPGSPLDAAQLGLNKPMGIAADSRGNMWIANSGLMNLPCPTVTVDLSNVGGSLSLLGADGQPVTSGENVFKGGGLTIAWGIAVDGDDNVWVSNFAGRRISQFCGLRKRNCRPGAKVGDPISGDRGYFFAGLTRSTAVEIDPSGNVWATNNWKQIPIQTNPGGLEIVAYVGAAAPIKTPLIGPPVPLMRR